jgi:hypothetical protein
VSEQRIYLKCSAKARTTQYGEMLNIGVKADDLIAFATQHANARGYVNLTVSARKEPGKFGDTHSVTLDIYEPKPKAAAEPMDAVDASDIPF